MTNSTVPGRRVVRPVEHLDLLEIGAAVQAHHLAAGLHDDAVVAADLVDQVARHAGLERLAAHQHRDGPGLT
jgi:hypothetical protein